MILYDPALTMRFQDYGIMLPIAPDRGDRTLRFLDQGYFPGTRGKTLPYPGPVFSITDALTLLKDWTVVTRRDLERAHRGEYIAGLYGDGAGPRSSRSAVLERALLETYELIDDQGRPRRYEPERAVKPLTDLFGLILAQVTGTYIACRLALADGPGFCYYLGGGTHHARYDRGSGFCLINDAAVAAFKVLSDGPRAFPRRGERGIRLIWIIDLDAHKGDGTAELVHFARDRGFLASPAANPVAPGEEGAGGAPRVLTLSIHMARGWPLDPESLAKAEPGRAPLVPSDVDIGIDEGDEAEYSPRLAAGMGELERISGEPPDLIIVVDGADPYEHDSLPSTIPLKLSLEQCLERDNLVYRYAVDRGIPSAWIMAGGYGDRAWEPAGHFLRGLR
ncbi:MAG: hypothetical protein LBG84_04625 [Treponema sp.]|jgi:acetoin utilization deacetylase AcuC-like enzyme|nr:hypothetical protein [Treponema sp.]